MKNIKNYNDFCNEEVDMKKLLIGGALVGGLAAGINSIDTTPGKSKASYEETELANFPEYHVHTAQFFDDNLNISINKNDGVIGTYRQAGKSSDYSVTVEEGVSTIYYETSTWGSYIYATTNRNDLPSGQQVNLNDLEIVKETSEYKILRVPSFWSSFDYVLVNKGYKNEENAFEIDGVKYTYFEPNFGFLTGKAAFVVKCK